MAPLIVILGPTASGKSSLALHLAKTFSGEIVGCDSVQVYRSLDIGTSKPTSRERSDVPHHLIDVVDPDQLFTAGDYAAQGRAVLAEISERRILPIVVGGTGFYLRALLMGLFSGPKRSEVVRDRLNEIVERKGLIHLHTLLQRIDPVSAKKISAKDRPKIVRALEVFLLTSKPISRHFDEGRVPLQGFKILKIGLNPPRKSLYEAIDRRVDKMFADGLVEEVKSILSRGYSPASKALNSLGYSQVVRHLQGELTLAETVEMTQRETRRYAKRQMTWFRKENEVIWYDGFGGDLSMQSTSQSIVRTFLDSLQQAIQMPEFRDLAGLKCNDDTTDGRM
ncbi:MAG TPA: tRNA (adenosine(37)-N6)-dimethylallyltransferase MiaA [Terriglobia bacterium]|nr:tRNA (adenosine(37)-N6)-dimethylallyltransferase MiaA [Terriglobia bacterium]